MRAFLLTWNPDKWDWIDLGQNVLATDEGRPVDEPWSTGSRKGGIYVGDRVFLLRQGLHGRGIVGSGQAIDSSGHADIDDEIVYRGDHWDGSLATANYVDVRWDRLVTPDNLLPLDEVQAEFPDQNWTPMASGTMILPELVPNLEAKWSDHVDHHTATRGGQGYMSDSDRRKAIEDAAQDWLMQHYRDEGWSVNDTRYSGPYDAIATKGEETLYLEAKGTQGSGDAVFLTHGEVAHARQHAGDCMIGIWSGMRFTDGSEIDQQRGESVIMPFEPDTGTLTPLQYRWKFSAEL